MIYGYTYESAVEKVILYIIYFTHYIVKKYNPRAEVNEGTCKTRGVMH